MASNGSHTATLSPTASGGIGSPLLSNPMSSWSSSAGSRHSASQVSKTYRQSSQLFLTRRLPEALSTLMPLITPSADEAGPDGAPEPAPVVHVSRTTRVKVWSLYLTILNAVLELDPNEGKDAFGAQEYRAICGKVRDGGIWEEVVRNGYHGVEGQVDSDVVINLATLLLAHARSQELNQKRLESFLAASNAPNLDISERLQAAQSPRTPSKGRRSHSRGGASGAETPRDLNSRVKILELYTLHVLLRNNEWDYAREFISVSSVLDEERRDAFLQALQNLQEEQEAAERRNREEEERQKDQLRRDIEEQRRLRAENEAREQRRLEEDRARRGGSELDYGIEQTPYTGGTRKARRNQAGPSALSGPAAKSSTSKEKSTAAPSLGGRVGMIMSNLRMAVEQMGASFRTNPMLLMRLVAFVIALIVMFGRRDVRERISRILGTSWNKVKATAGMGVKVSYI